jgi:hypothetical protein
MTLIYLLIIGILCAATSASHVYILITKELSSFEVCVFVFLATVELIMVAIAAAALAREI